MNVKEAGVVGSRPRVSIFYAHTESNARVVEFATSLRTHGIDAQLDEFVLPMEGWVAWMDAHTQDADFFIIVCAKKYSDIVRGNAPAGVGKGVVYEYRQISQRIYEQGGLNDRVIPIGFSSEDRSFAPPALTWAHYYNIADENEYRDLIKRLYGTIPHAPPLGEKPAWATPEGAAEAEISAKYATDRYRLKERTKTSLQRLSTRSRFRIGDGSVSIERAHLGSILNAATSSTPTLVVGDPGSGKSALLQMAAEALLLQSNEVIFLDAAMLDLASVSDLNADLRIAHELDDIILNWSGSNPAYLFIDSLDSARTGKGAEVLRSLIARLANEESRWSIVASVRQYDLRYDIALQRSFNTKLTEAIPEEHTSAEFRRLGINHIYIGKLLDSELEDAALQSSELASVLEDAPSDFRELLRNALHLSLVADLLTITNRSTLVDITTQLELLDLWWRQRVLIEDSDQAERILGNACTEMLGSRSLFASRNAIDNIDLTLKRNLLSEYVEEGRADRYRVTFTHTLIFDYAIERLMLRGEPGKLIHIVTKNKDAAVLILPSLRLHARHLWEQDHANRHRYWQAIETFFGAEGVPDVANATMVAVSAEEFSVFNDVKFALSLRSPSAILAFSYFVRAMIYLATSEAKKFLGTEAPNLTAVLDFISRDIEYFGNDAYIMLDELTERQRLPFATPAQLSSIGASARRILAYSFSNTASPIFVGRCIRAVVRTYSSNPDASRLSLSRLFNAGELNGHKAERAKFLTFEISSLVADAPEFVADAFESLMSHDVGAAADERVELTRSQIFGLFSSLKNDYSTGLNSLVRTLSTLFSCDYVSGLRGISAILEHERRTRMAIRTYVAPDIPFSFHGRAVTYRPDYSQYWDDGRRLGQNDAVDALDLLFSKFRNDAGSDDIAELLTSAGERIKLAAFWRRLLFLGSEDPEHFAELVHEIAATPTLLVEGDLCPDAIFAYLKNSFPHLSSRSQESIKRAIESLPLSGPKNSAQGHAAYFRKLMLKEIVHHPEQSEHLPQGKAFSSPPSADLRAYSLGDLENEDPDLVDILGKGEATWRSLANLQATEEQGMQVKQNLERLLELEARAISEQTSDRVWNLIAGLVHRMASSELVNVGDEFKWMKRCALRAAKSPSPRPDPQHDSQFDKSTSWGAPFARIEACGALLSLHRKRPDDHEILEALFDATRDESPIVRHQIAFGLASMDVAPQVIWNFADVLIHDQNRGVLWGVVAGAGRRLGALDLNRWSDAVAIMFDTATKRDGNNQDLQRQLTLHIAIAGLSGNTKMFTLLDRLLTTDYGSDEDAKGAAMTTVAFALNSANPPELRSKTRVLLEKAVQSGADVFRLMAEGDNEATLRRRFAPVQTIIERLFYDSGAYEPINGDIHEKAENFWQDFGNIMKAATAFPFPSTVHHVVQIAAAFSDEDPAIAFSIAAGAIISGQVGHYQFDLFAIDEMVKLVRLYLARYHELLESRDDTRRELVKVVDIFARAGWPQAMALVFDLRELYR